LITSPCFVANDFDFRRNENKKKKKRKSDLKQSGKRRKKQNELKPRGNERKRKKRKRRLKRIRRHPDRLHEITSSSNKYYILFQCHELLDFHTNFLIGTEEEGRRRSQEIG